MHPHQVTQATIRDFINRSLAFAHKALAAARDAGPFDYVDFARQAVGYDSNPFVTLQVTLVRNTADAFAAPQNVVEPPYNYSVHADRTVLTLPHFAVVNKAFLSDLFGLLNLEKYCMYAADARAQMDNGTLPESPLTFEDRYFSSIVLADDGYAPECLIPELGTRPEYLRVWNLGLDGKRFTLDSPLWHLREDARLSLNHYDPLPDTVLAALDPEKIRHVYPHLPQKEGNAGMIAYTQSATAGAMDRQAVMRAGRFIRQYGRDDLTDEQVKQLAAEIAAYRTADIHHSNKREDYKRVYIDGPDSCMAYDETGKEFGRLKIDGKFVHPTEVYAHPDNDLEIVWLEVGGDIVARTIINKSKMQYPRVYAKESVARAKERLEAYLHDLGYTRADYALGGQKLLRLSPDKFPRAIICPYIDVHNIGVDVFDDYLETGGSEQANHETGCLSGYDTANRCTWSCDCCDTDYDDDDNSYLDYAGDYICESCVDDYRQAFCASPQEERWVPVDSDYLYDLRNVNRGPLRHYSFFYSHRNSALSDWDLVALDDSYYDDNQAALIEDCVRTEDGEYMLTEDLEDRDMFINRDNDEACDMDEWAVCIDADGGHELVRIDDIDNEAFEQAPHALSDEYPMLLVFTAIAQEEAA